MSCYMPEALPRVPRLSAISIDPATVHPVNTPFVASEKDTEGRDIRDV